MNTNLKVYDLTEKYPLLKDFLIAKGFDQMKNTSFFRVMGKRITLKDALSLKGLDEKTFLEEFATYKNISHMDEKVEEKAQKDAYLVAGSLPCPVRIPLVDELNSYNRKYNISGIRYDLRSANLGLEFVLDKFKTNNPLEYPDLITSAGYDLIIRGDIRNKISDNYVVPDVPFNREMTEKITGLKDPHNLYRIVAVVPAIFVVNKTLLGTRKMPTAWSDILEEEFDNSLAIPMMDLDMYNALILTLYSKYKEEGLQKLKRSIATSLHPAQMVKGRQNNAPCISLIPYFFASMVSDANQMVIWPKDGAIISPIFLTVKKGSLKGIQSVIDYLLTKEVSTILGSNGKFPVTTQGVEKQLQSEQKLLFASWDFLYNLDEHLPIINKYFNLQ